MRKLKHKRVVKELQENYSSVQSVEKKFFFGGGVPSTVQLVYRRISRPKQQLAMKLLYEFAQECVIASRDHLAF